MGAITGETRQAGSWKRVDEFDLIEPSGRWRRFRKLTRAEIWENRTITAAALVFSAAIWFVLFSGLWRWVAAALGL
jgi:hypothetical protein